MIQWNLILLSEIGASTSRHGSQDDTEAELMRLSADPFLLHTYLQNTVAVPHPIEPDTHWKLIVYPPAPPVNAGQRRTNRLRQYDLNDTRSVESSRPESFVATREDITSALEQGATKQFQNDTGCERKKKLHPNAMHGNYHRVLWVILTVLTMVITTTWLCLGLL